MNYQEILNEIYNEVNLLPVKGKVASYIPELAKISSNKFGVNLVDLNGNNYNIGNSDERFSIQSIVKVLSLALAFEIEGNDIWKRTNVEPSGSSFNSLIQLEYENGIPRNPLINSGALVICDILMDKLPNPKKDFLRFIQKLAGNSEINYNFKVAESEKEHKYRNAALANLMKSFGNINNKIEPLLDFYFSICSIEMNCEELSKTFLLFANRGKILETGEVIISSSKSKRINAIMQTCGFYDEAGEFSFRVGLPGKSGVGGGIVAINPHEYSIAVWSPLLNQKGNSIKGMKLLELLTTKTEVSIF